MLRREHGNVALKCAGLRITRFAHAARERNLERVDLAGQRDIIDLVEEEGVEFGGNLGVDTPLLDQQILVVMTDLPESGRAGDECNGLSCFSATAGDSSVCDSLYIVDQHHYQFLLIGIKRRYIVAV